MMIWEYYKLFLISIVSHLYEYLEFLDRIFQQFTKQLKKCDDFLYIII